MRPRGPTSYIDSADAAHFNDIGFESLDRQRAGSIGPRTLSTNNNGANSDEMGYLCCHTDTDWPLGSSK